MLAELSKIGTNTKLASTEKQIVPECFLFFFNLAHRLQRVTMSKVRKRGADFLGGNQLCRQQRGATWVMALLILVYILVIADPMPAVRTFDC